MTTVAAAARKPRLTMSIPDRSIRRGSKVKVVARVIDPSTGRAVKRGSVRLQGFRHGAYRTWQIRRVGSSGRVTFWSKPSRTAAMRVVYFGAGRYRNTAIKRGVRVTVRARNGSSSARILAEARRQRGKRYVFGAAGPNTFDCSGYTMYVYRRAVGKRLPHNANAQQRYGWGVSHRNMRGGDLIVFRNGSYGYHVGIYAGGGYMWAAPHSGDVVRRQRVYSNNYVVRRLA